MSVNGSAIGKDIYGQHVYVFKDSKTGKVIARGTGKTPEDARLAAQADLKR